MKLEEFAANNARPLPPLADLDLAGKKVAITGANTGIGYEIMRYHLEKKASLIVMLCRFETKAQEAKTQILAETRREASSIRIEQVDLGSFASVSACADRLESSLDSLDILHNHAGLGLLKKSVTTDGYETVAQVNALSCMLLAIRLHPLLVKTAKANGSITRSVFTCTDALFFYPDPTDRSLQHFCSKTELDGHEEEMAHYMGSKYFMAILVCEYARRIASSPVAVLLAAPGLTQSEFGQKSTDGTTHADQRDVQEIHGMSGRTNAEGAKTIIVAATEPLEKWGLKEGKVIRLSNSVLEPAPEKVSEQQIGEAFWSEFIELVGSKYTNKVPADLW